MTRYHPDDMKNLEEPEQFTSLMIIARNARTVLAVVLTAAAGCTGQATQSTAQLSDDFYTRQIQRNPSSETYSSRARAKQSKGDLDGAIADYTEAIELKPSFSAYSNRARARRAKGDVVGAIADLTEAIQLNPIPVAYSDRGAARQANGDLDGAIADYTKAIELNPHLESAYRYRGNSKQAKGDLDGAIADYTKAIEINPHYANAYNDRGDAQAAKGDLDGANADHAKAVELSAAEEKPRPLTKEDGLNCSFTQDLGLSLGSGFSGSVSTTVNHFKCKNKDGKEIEIELISTDSSENGMVAIRTKNFGTVYRGNEPGKYDVYYITDSQIKKLKKFLGF